MPVLTATPEPVSTLWLDGTGRGVVVNHGRSVSAPGKARRGDRSVRQMMANREVMRSGIDPLRAHPTLQVRPVDTFCGAQLASNLQTRQR